MTTPRITTLIRRNDVFERVLRGETYAEIGAALGRSEDTIARDMAAISEEVKTLARERFGVLVAVALEHYQFVIDEAKKNYFSDTERLEQWYSAKLDYQTETQATKTLAIEGGGAGDGPQSKASAAEALYRDLAIQHESQPLEVTRTRRRIRPQLVADRAAWLRLMLDATREFCALMGINKLIVELSGPGGGPVEGVVMSLAEWEAKAKQRLQDAEATYSLLGDDAEGDETEDNDA